MSDKHKIKEDESIDSWITPLGKYVKLKTHKNPWYKQKNITKNCTDTSSIITPIKQITEKKYTNTNLTIILLILLLIILIVKVFY